MPSTAAGQSRANLIRVNEAVHVAGKMTLPKAKLVRAMLNQVMDFAGEVLPGSCALPPYSETAFLAELGERLSRHFASVTWYGQRPFSPDYIAWLGRVGRRWPALAVKLHQARKCLGWPWESPQQHRPSPCNGDLGFTEVLIAACQTASNHDTVGIS